MRESSRGSAFAVAGSVALFLFVASTAGAESERIPAQRTGDKLVLSVEGENVSLKVKDLPAKGVFSFVAHAMADGLFAVHISGKEGDVPAVELVAVKRPGTKRLELVWRGDPAPRGDIGERSHEEARLEDLTGDDLPEIVVGTVYEPARICSVERPPLLFRRVYDPKGKKLRFVSAARPGLAAPEVIVGTTREGKRETLFDILSPSCVSHSMGDGNQTLMLSPPATMVDGDESTYWLPGNGTGAGEFAGFEVRARVYGLSEIGLTRARGKGMGRVESVLLVTEGGLFRLVFPEGAEGGETVWFRMKAPVKTGCLTLVVEKTEGEGAKRSAGLAEVVALSEIDGPDGPATLARDLSSGERGEAAASLLGDLEEGCVDPVVAAWPKLSPSGRRRGARLLAENAPGDAVDTLARAAVSADDILVETALLGLAKVREDGVTGLADFLEDEDDEVFRRAATAVSKLGGASAVRVLAKSCGRGDRGRRDLLRSSLARLALGNEDWAAALGETIDGAEQIEIELDLLRAGAVVPFLAGMSAQRAVEILEKAETFGDRYRALQVVVAASRKDDREILDAAAADPDEQVRALALAGLIRTAGPKEESRRICDALEDDSAVVRSSTLRGLSSAGFTLGCAGGLENAALADPWPTIRSEALTLLVREVGEGAITTVTKASGDESALVRVAAVEAAGILPGQEMEQVVLGALSRKEKDLRVIRAAVLAAGRRCSPVFVEALKEVLEKGAAPLAGPRKIELGVAAATALGFIGGEEAKEALEEGSRMANPTVERAVKKALEAADVECSGPVVKKKAKGNEK